MKIAVAKEIEVGERRVALVPDIVARLVKQGLEVWVEAGAGERSFFSDAAYEAAHGCIVIPSVDRRLQSCINSSSCIAQVFPNVNHSSRHDRPS